MSDPQEVRRVTKDCLTSFDTVQNQQGFPLQIHSWAENQSARLRMWAASLGVNAKGRMSIAYRLRLNASMVTMIIQVLESIASSLKSILSMKAHGRKISLLSRPRWLSRGWATAASSNTFEDRQNNVTNSISLLLDLATDLRKLGTPREEQRALRHNPVDAEKNSLEPEFRQYVKLMCHIHLVSSRKAVTQDHNEGSGNARAVDRGYLKEHEEPTEGFRLHFGENDLFCSALNDIRNDDISDSNFIELRLRETILQRWRLLCYRAHHAETLASEWSEDQVHVLSKNAEEVSVQPATPHAEIASAPQDQRTTISSVATTVHTDYTVLTKAERAPKTVMTKSGVALRDADFPKAPRIEHGEAKCPLCHVPMPASDLKGTKWKSVAQWSHVFRDLAPYICVFRICPSPNARFATSHLLKQHLETAHFDRIWVCPVCVTTGTEEAGFRDPEGFTSHLKTLHQDRISDADLQILLSHAVQREPHVLQSCVFCQGHARDFSRSVTKHWESLVDHMARDHMQSLSMFSLPWHVQGLDEASGTRDSSIDSSRERIEEELFDADSGGRDSISGGDGKDRADSFEKFDQIGTGNIDSRAGITEGQLTDFGQEMSLHDRFTKWSTGGMGEHPVESHIPIVGTTIPPGSLLKESTTRSSSEAAHLATQRGEIKESSEPHVNIPQQLPEVTYGSWVDDAWPEKIRQYWDSLGLVEQTILSSKDEYRDALKDLCTLHRERSGVFLSNQIIRQHSPILRIASALDIVQDYDAPSTLTALILGVSWKAIQAALGANGLKLAHFAKVTKLLDSQVIGFNYDNLRLHQNKKSVRQPLQNLLLCYMDAYTTIFARSAPPVLDLEQFKRTVDEKKDYFEQQRKDWEKAFEQARQEEQDRIDNGPSTIINGVPWQPASSRQNVGARFDFVRELGRGHFGHVCLVREPHTGELFARKFISAPLATTESGRRKLLKGMVVNEVEIMKKLPHHHIAAVLLYLEADDGFSLIMPTVGDCNLHYFLQERCINAKFPRKEVKLLDRWFGCLVFALAFAHTHSIKHEDLKPSNILIKGDQVYLADFGCATDFEHASSDVSADENTLGTVIYWPPEHGKERGRSADIFSLGCVFSEMLTVRQGRTLNAYLVHRKVENHESPYRFSRNLPAVQDWLKSLPDTEGDIPQFLLEIILAMVLEDKDQRKDARQLKRLFRGKEELLCESCW